MAEKQFARNDADNFAGLAEDDPLSELARIVGYDARPAVETLKELKRHQETVKIDPPFNLEDELLREFDRYAGSQDAAPAPVVADVVPTPAEIAVRPPVVETADGGAGATFAPTSAVEASFVDAAPAPVFARSERDAFEAPAPAADDAAHLFDLADELEFSMRSETAAAAPSDDEPVFNAPAFDMSVFDDIALDEPVEAVVPQPETVRREAPVAAQPVERVEPSFDQPLSFTAARPEVVVPPSPAAVAAEPEMSEVDKLLADVARFPVPPVAPRAAEPVLPVQEPGTPAKKQNYPFTPVFSRATPVAGSSGSRSYATPAIAEPAVAVPQAAPVSAPVAAAAAAIPAVAAAPVAVAASEPEPDFDLANFERELSDIQFDMDLFDEPQAATGGPVVDQIFAAQPEPLYAAPQRQAAAPEPVREPEPAAIEEPVEEALPFDPAMIAETEEHPSAISEMDVPALPVHEEPQSVVPLHADFDLDLDAEMAQLFAEHQPATVETPTPVAKASATADVAETFNIFSRESAPAVVTDFQVDEDVRRAFEAQRAQFGAAPDRVDAFNFEAYDNVSPAAESGQRSRLPVYAAAAAIVLLLGGAGLYVWMGGSDAALTAEGPKVILADKDPVKIVPEEKGGKTVPNQDKAVYDRVAGTQDATPRQEALVSTKEEPLDVVQRTLTPETLPLPDEEDGAAAPADTTTDAAENRLLPEGQEAAAAAKDEQNPAVAPRKVRTMIVKPDGTLVAREEPVSEPVATATTTLPAATETVPAATASDVALAAPTTTTTTTTTVPVTPATTEPATATEAAATPAIDTPANTPVPQMRPAEQPVNVVGTVTENGNLRPTASPETQVAAATPSQTTATQPVSSATAEAAATTVAPGTYVIQIASVPNEADAQKTFTSLSSKFGSVIGGRGVDIKRADIAGKGTFYRVRIPAGSKEEANQLCARYKSAGGSCLVTR